MKILLQQLLGALLLFLFSSGMSVCRAQNGGEKVPEQAMKQVYEEIKTPYKYGLVLVPADDSKKTDSPSVFRRGGKWFMTYIIFDGRGYETWLSESKDLLKWTTLGRIMSFSDSTAWDWNQKAGYISLEDPDWGGSYHLKKYAGKFWMSYLGGNSRGYESGLLSIGIAHTGGNPASVHEWQYPGKPVLSAKDPGVRWWENITIYKSTVIRDAKKQTGRRFVMYYNAKGDSLNSKRGAERIGMAVSDDMVHWQRYGKDPVIDHHQGISGDAFLQKMGKVWVMFYFGAFWKDRPSAFNRFACSYDLVHWTDWQGDDLVKPSEPYDEVYAHKSFVVKHKGVVYHFYCAVNKKGQRGIAVATSKDMGKSNLQFDH